MGDCLRRPILRGNEDGDLLFRDERGRLLTQPADIEAKLRAAALAQYEARQAAPNAEPGADPPAGQPVSRRAQTTAERAVAAARLRESGARLRDSLAKTRVSAVIPGGPPLPDFTPEQVDAGVTFVKSAVGYGVATAKNILAALHEHIGANNSKLADAIMAAYRSRWGGLPDELQHLREQFGGVPDSVSREFLDRAADPDAKEYGGLLHIPKYPGLDSYQRQVEAYVVADVEHNAGSLAAEYRREHPVVVNTDLVKHLFAPYREDPTEMSDVVHEAAGAIKNLVFEQMVREPAPNGKKEVVFFLAGGPGSGKSTAIGDVRSAAQEHSQAQVVVDSTLSSEKSAKRQIDLARAHQKDVAVYYIHTPIEAAVKRAVERAERGGVDSGRVVPLDAMARTHYGAQQTLLRIAKDYGDRVKFYIMDNRGDPGTARLSSTKELAQEAYDSEDAVAKRAEAAYDRYSAERAAAGNPIPENLDRAFRAGQIRN